MIWKVTYTNKQMWQNEAHSCIHVLSLCSHIQSVTDFKSSGICRCATGWAVHSIMKRYGAVRTPGTPCPVTQHHIPQDMNLAHTALLEVRTSVPSLHGHWRWNMVLLIHPNTHSSKDGVETCQTAQKSRRCRLIVCLCSDSLLGHTRWQWIQSVLHNTAVPEYSHFSIISWPAQEESNFSSTQPMSHQNCWEQFWWKCHAQPQHNQQSAHTDFHPFRPPKSRKIVWMWWQDKISKQVRTHTKHLQGQNIEVSCWNVVVTMAVTWKKCVFINWYFSFEHPCHINNTSVMYSCTLLSKTHNKFRYRTF